MFFFVFSEKSLFICKTNLCGKAGLATETLPDVPEDITDSNHLKPFAYRSTATLFNLM